MAISLYVHVPFCLQKCAYCNFVSYPLEEETARRYRDCLLKEMALCGEVLAPPERELATVYLGGGTPTCLPAGLLEDILEGLHRYFDWPLGIEATVEANPGTVDAAKLKMLREAGINRLSLGVQSCQDHHLDLLGRLHGFRQAVEAVLLARQVGFSNLNVDLIFALPGQTLPEWRRCLEEILALAPEHISAYSLEVEEGTPLARRIQGGGLAPCEEETELAMYLEAIAFLKENGYEHYEISNFARPGFRCRHNLAYWEHRPYLGLGLAAHSFLDRRRRANVCSLEEYCARLEAGELPAGEEEELSEEALMGEAMFLGLRLLEGVSLEGFARRFGKNPLEVFAPQIASLCRRGLLEISSGHLRLTSRGLPLANMVFREFILP
mgnify:CR=1 FL=1